MARLSNSGQPALYPLTSRSQDDFTIALLDAWATVADVLTFYQERIANELYLKTATERFSVLELARLIGYELRPGVASDTYLAFTLEDTPALNPLLPGNTKGTAAGLPPITIEAGAKVQSVPGPGEQAQIFETTAKIEARAEWNAAPPRLTQPQKITPDSDAVVLKGTAANVKPGDIVLIHQAPDTRKMRKIRQVEVVDETKTTKVYFVPEAPPASVAQPVFSDLPPKTNLGQISELAVETVLKEDVVDKIIGKTWKAADLEVLLQTKNWSAEQLVASVVTAFALSQSAPDTSLYVFRKHTAVFGYNAPKQVDYIAGVPKLPSLWVEWCLDENAGQIFLDSAYEEILPGGFVGIQKPNQSLASATVYPIDQVEVRSRTAYGLSAKTTLLHFSQPEKWWDPASGSCMPVEDSFKSKNTNRIKATKPALPDTLSAIREITVYAQSEPLELADLPITDDVKSNAITLNRLYLGFQIGQKVVLTGNRSDLPGVSASEVLTVGEVYIDQGYTALVFTSALNYTYIRKSVTINANVTAATHGETVQEVLGSGDAGKIFQQFVLRQPPLTYVSGISSGGTTTLEIRVNDLLWHEVPAFLEHGPEERIYTTRLDDEGHTTVIFGDGETGARLPSGQENVKAKYRRGIGLGGLVKAQQLSQLMTRPLGVKSATNPVAATGAEDRESLDKARRNAPLAILTLDRIVSLQDYEDFARSFAGIDKALATWTWSSQKRGVFLTVAGAKGAPVDNTNPLCQNLTTALQKAGGPHVPLAIQSYEPRFFRVTAHIQVHPDYLAEKVLAAVEQQLRERFSFDEREFGQPVARSEVIAVMQNVAGVTAVDVDEFYRSDEPATLKPLLAADMPRPGSNNVVAAELLMLDPQPLALKVML